MKLRRLVVLGAAALTTAVVASVAALVATAGSSPVVAAPRIPPARPAVSVPQGALVLARQDGTRVLALSVRRDGARVRARVTVLGPEGTGVGGLAVTVGGVRAMACGRGCYAASLPRAEAVESLSVRLLGPGDRTSSASFALPRGWPISAVAELRETERTLKSASSVVYRDRLESVPGQSITTTWRVVAPDRLAYTVNNGTCAVVVGQSRWDRESARRPVAALTSGAPRPPGAPMGRAHAQRLPARPAAGHARQGDPLLDVRPVDARLVRRARRLPLPPHPLAADGRRFPLHARQLPGLRHRRAHQSADGEWIGWNGGGAAM